MRFVGFWGRRVGSGKGKANRVGGGGGRGGGLIRSALTTGIRGLEKKRDKNEADVAEKGRPDVFNS